MLGLVAVAIAVGGCGNGHSNNALSSDEYADAVTHICTSSGTELRRLVVASRGNFLVRKGDAFVEIADRNLTRLKSLRAPPELEQKARLLVADAEATRDRLVSLIRAAKKKPGSVDLGSSALIETRRRMIEAATAVGATC